MNIFRKCYNQTTADSDLLYDLNKLGFNQLDGTPYDINGGVRNKHITLHWKKDNTYSVPTSSDDYTNSPIPYGDNLGNYGFYMMKPRSRYSMDDALGTFANPFSYSPSSSDYYMNLIFVPLINNGFCLISIVGGYNSPWTKNRPTLPILPINDWYYNGGNDYQYIDYYIGLKTNFTDNPYSYITSLSGDSTGPYGPHFWPGDGSTNLLPIPGVDESEHQDTVSYNTNVCTLAKIPYNSTYINGIYLCTTSPFADGVSGKIFSFGGRTFMGIYNNLVLELPSN